VQQLVYRLRDEFARYVAGNAAIHFSAGIATQKPGAPISALASLAEDALEASKGFDGKNAVTCFGATVPWSRWPQIEEAITELGGLTDDARLSRGFVYGLQGLVDMRAREESGEPQGAMWRARLAYRAKRFVNDSQKGADESVRMRRTEELRTRIGGKGIQDLGTAYRIVLFNHLYRLRDR
jgi:CRISPR-associated protein Csm1